MLVASGVECGDDGKTAVALLPQVIGNVQTAIGCATLTRADGVAAQVMVGAPVCEGDVIATGPDGRIEIRFIDDTVFKLSGDSRVVLREFVCDTGRADAALLAVTKRTFAFIGGRVARTGSLWVDTPVGSIRGRPNAGGFGMLWLTALVFSFLKEAHAADPDVTFPDDDRITYKDFEHGSFEIITKEAIPRHIIVEDPGETIVLSRKGSSVGVSQVANTPARMEELRAAQQDALANYAEGFGHNGSSTPPFLNQQQLLQPINFIQTDTVNPQNSLAPVEAAVFRVQDIVIVPPPRPTLAITGIAGQIDVATNNLINAAKADAGVEITGTTSGVEDGRIVTVTIVGSSNQVVYSGTATVANGAWSIDVSPVEAKALADGIYTLTADVSNAAGDPADATQSIKVDETPPTIAISTIVGNNVVNVKAASAGFTIAGTTTDAENGQPVTVKIIDASGHVVDTFTTTLTNNAWSVKVTPTEAKLLHDGSYTVTADVSDSAGNPAPEATQTLTVDETPPTVTWLPSAERGTEGAGIALGTIAATANSLPGHSNAVQSLVVSGIPVGAALTDGTNCFMATSGDTSVDVKSWNLSNLKITPPNDSNFTLTVTATDQDANTASASELVTVAPLAPAVNPVAAHGNEDTAIALDLGVMARSLLGANGDASPNSLAALVVSDIPAGATLSDGTDLPGHSFTATADNTSFDVAGWNLSSLKIAPAPGFEGCFTLAIAATERDSEGDISATVTATEVVTVAAVAEPPTASAPATLALNESATCVAIAGVSVGPLAEDSDDRVSATLTVSHGTLHVASLSGVTVTGDDCATLTLSGSAAAVNTLLAGLTYTPTHEYEGSDTLRLSVTSSDGSNTYPTAANASTAITVNPVARPPTASAPATLTLHENASCVAITGVSVGPRAEDNDDTVSATLTVSHGTLHVASLSGVTVTGDDCATLTLSGSAAAVNTLLAGLTYTPTHEYEGSDTLHLSVTSSDGSNTYPTVATASTAITVRDLDDDDVENHGTLAANASGGSGTEISDPPAASGTVTSGATGENVPASATATNFAGASRTNASLVPGSMLASGMLASAPDNNSAVNALNFGDTLNDVILGGFGAVLLTAGSANHTFGHSFAAYSNAAQLDTITGFASGSDRIDLTAFGALASAVLALTPRSTSVPAHTIAWLVHNATNETVVYVNPTDQALSIGESGLVEIHLQGVSSIHSSDFILAPTSIGADSASIDPAAATAGDAVITATATTNASSASIADDGTFLAAVRADSIDHTADNTVTTLPSGPSVGLPHVSLIAPMQPGFVFDPKPLFNSVDPTTIDHNVVMHGPALASENWILPSATGSVAGDGHDASSQKNPGSTNADDPQDHAADFDSKPGSPEASEKGVGHHWASSEAGKHDAPPMHGAGVRDVGPFSIDIDSNAAFHPGGLKASENGVGHHWTSSEAGEHDAPPMHGAGVHDIGPSSIAHAVFGSRAVDALGPGDSFHFKDETSGSDVIGLAVPEHVQESGHHDGAAGAYGSLAAGPPALDLPLPVPADDLSIAPDHGKSHLVTHVQHDLIV